MDKRWILILIIIIIACGCGYFIINSSTTVGNAIADVNKFTVTIPEGFSSGESASTSLLLIKKQSVEKIYIEDLGKKDIALDKYNSDAKKLSNIISNSTEKIEVITVYTLYYEDSSNSNSLNMSNSYLCTYGHTFLVKMTGFDNTDDMNKNLNFVAKTLKPDYKQSQD